MSWYTAGEILIWLILAAILGFILGWLVHWFVSRRGATTDTTAVAVASSDSELKELRDSNAALKAEMDTSDKENEELQAELDACKADKATLQADLDASRALVASAAAARAAAVTTTVASPAPAKPVATTKPVAPKAKPAPAKAAPKPAPAAVPTTKAAAVKAVGTIAARTAGAAPAPKDDLEQIFGVGPVISKMLNKMKITSFRQVARFTPQDIATVEKALEFFPDRIVRDDWMSSARELNIAKYGFDPTKGAGKTK